MKKIIAIILVLLACTIFISGCIEETKIKSQEQAGEAMMNVTESIEKIGSTLEDIDESLG